MDAYHMVKKCFQQEFYSNIFLTFKPISRGNHVDKHHMTTESTQQRSIQIFCLLSSQFLEALM